MLLTNTNKDTTSNITYDSMAWWGSSFVWGDGRAKF
jgi:hypothetical protein